MLERTFDEDRAELRRLDREARLAALDLRSDRTPSGRRLAAFSTDRDDFGRPRPFRSDLAPYASTRALVSEAGTVYGVSTLVGPDAARAIGERIDREADAALATDAATAGRSALDLPDRASPKSSPANRIGRVREPGRVLRYRPRPDVPGRPSTYS